MSELQPPPSELLQVNDVPLIDSVNLPPEPIPGPTKRHRRPSVRLGEIGNIHRRPKWKYSKDSKDLKGTKTRHVMNISGIEFNESQEPRMGDKDMKFSGFNGGFSDGMDIKEMGCGGIGGGVGGWKVKDSAKPKRGGLGSAKRVRTNWGGGEKFGDDDEDFDDVDRYSDYERDGDDGGDGDGDGSQLKEQSLNVSMDYGNRDGVRVRVSDGDCDTDGKNWNNNNGGGLERNGVRVWLNQLGLGRYFSVFEVHEVDDEVLPLLTLEDLKDMGINAVGSRRKMFCSIQKLGKGFS